MGDYKAELERDYYVSILDKDSIYNLETDENLVITWSRNPHAKTPIPRKPCKSSLIVVWHKDNLYLGTNTIRNGNPPNKYWFANKKYKDDATKTVVLQ